MLNPETQNPEAAGATERSYDEEVPAEDLIERPPYLPKGKPLTPEEWRQLRDGPPPGYSAEASDDN